MGTFNERGAERRLLRALQRARGPQIDPATATKRLRELAATLPSARRGVSNDVEASKKHARALARELKLDKGTTYDLVLASELHEIGKALLPRDLLYSPGELDPTMKEIVESHAEQGALLTESIERPVVTAALGLQNEHFDGSGPKRIAGDDLPLVARALAVVSAFVAMCAQRPFRAALDRDHALEVLRSQAGRQFDPAIVEAFARTLPQRKVAAAAIDAGAALARPLRGAQLAYRRHGRVSTVAVSAFSAVAVIIGASTLAPDGIGRAIERIGWPAKVGPSATTQDAAVAATAEEQADDGAVEGLDPSTDAVEIVGAAAADGAFGTYDDVSDGAASTKVTEIRSSYTYRSTQGTDPAAGQPGDDGTTTSGGSTYGSSPPDDGTTDDDPDDEGSTSSSEGSTYREQPAKGKDKEKNKDASTDEPEETDAEEPQDTEEPDEGEEEEKKKAKPSPEETEDPDDAPSSGPSNDYVANNGYARGHDKQGSKAVRSTNGGNGKEKQAAEGSAEGPSGEGPEAAEEDESVEEPVAEDSGGTDGTGANDEPNGNGQSKKDRESRPANDFEAYQAEDEEYLSESETDEDGTSESEDTTESESLGSMGEQPAATEAKMTAEPAPTWETLH